MRGGGKGQAEGGAGSAWRAAALPRCRAAEPLLFLLFVWSVRREEWGICIAGQDGATPAGIGGRSPARVQCSTVDPPARCARLPRSFHSTYLGSRVLTGTLLDHGAPPACPPALVLPGCTAGCLCP